MIRLYGLRKRNSTEITKVLYNARMFKVKQYYTVYVTFYFKLSLYTLYLEIINVFLFLKKMKQKKNPNKIESNIK